MLSALTGIAAEEIEADGAEARAGRATHACAYCLLLNAWDVAAPYWRRRWLQGRLQRLR
jgi:hypothetical protein